MFREQSKYTHSVEDSLALFESKDNAYFTKTQTDNEFEILREEHRKEKNLTDIHIASLDAIYQKKLD